MLFLTLYFVYYSISTTSSARILALLPSASYSHQLIAREIMIELNSRGHEILVMTTDPLGTKAPENYKEIDVSYLYKYIDKNKWSNAIDMYRLIGMYVMFSVKRSMAEEVFAMQEVKDLIKNKNEHFDLVIYEWSSQASYTAFGEHFNCPIIGIRSLGLRIEVHDAVGNPVTPSYISVAFMEYGDDFINRLINTLIVVFTRLWYEFIELPLTERIVKDNFPNHETYVGDLEKNVSITFTYTNPIIMGVRPLVPSVIEIGGLHLGKRVKEALPNDINAYLDNSKLGAIFFSLGTLISTKEIPLEKLNMLKEIFLQLPYNIILKSEINLFNETIKNVKCFKWLSQESILEHPNVRLFISHGGLLSLWESVFYRVPILAIPFNTDQFYNAIRIKELGIGLRLDFKTLTKSNMLYAVNEIMTNRSYEQNIEKIATLIKDQPISQTDKLVWWTEYVLRHRGAPHLKSKAIGMPWYIYYSLDVICFISVILMLILYVVNRILKFICSFIHVDNKKEKTQ